jgi:hypothetical protein
MRSDHIRIFIGSSYTMKEMCQYLAVALRKDANIIVNAWYETDVFPQGRELSLSMEEALKKNDFFVFLFSPDFPAPGSFETSGQERLLHLTRRNVILEVGAVWGRYGRDRLIMFGDPKSPPPSDFSGVNIPYFDAAATGEDAEREAQDMADRIRTHIDGFFAGLGRLTGDGKTEKSDNKRRWLTFLECAANSDEEVLENIINSNNHSKGEWGIEIEDAGVIFGYPDAFILFNAPTVRDGTTFLKKVRTSFKSKLWALDSRSIYVDSYWSVRSNLGMDKKASQITLYSCQPEHIEDVFRHIALKAPHPSPYSHSTQNWTDEVIVQSVGIILGADDVFVIVSSDSATSLRQFATSTLRELASFGWVRRNSSSLAVERVRQL